MKSMISSLALGATLVLMATVFSGAQCFPRQCDSAANCERSCECIDAEDNVSITCPAFFQCDLEKGVCSDDYDLSCDEICSRFAANGRCGSQACDANPQCLRQAQCALADAQGGILCEYNCDRSFECTPDSQTCEPGFASSDADLCASPECNPCGAVPACDAACVQQ